MPDGDDRPHVAWAGVTIDCLNPELLAEFWAALLDLPVRAGGPQREDWYRVGPGVTGGPVLNFQPVAEENEGKVRLHLDLWVDDLPGAVARVLALGGRSSGRVEVLERGTIAVMFDPEGHEFCVISATSAQPSEGR